MAMALRMAVACLAVAVPAKASAAPVTSELQPSSKWVMSYQDASCVLQRAFGEGDQTIMLQFTRFSPGDPFSLRAFGKLFSSGDPYQDIRIAFGETPAERPLRDRLSGRTDKKMPFVDLGAMTLADPTSEAEPEPPMPAPLTAQQEAAVDTFTIGPVRGRIMHLRLGSMRGPMQAMRKCTDDLIKHWGYDPAVVAAFTRPVEPASNPGRWLGSNDYPSDKLLEGKLAAFEFRLDIDETGKVTRCAPLRLAGDAEFGTTSCNLIQRRAKFRPALDRDGKPAKSYYINRVNWIQ